MSGADIGIDFAHHEIHEGDHYFVQASSVMANAAVIDFCVQTPDNGKEAHMLFDFSASFSLDIVAYEASTWTTCGTSVTPRNSKRSSSNTSSLTVYNTTNGTGTGVTAGTQILSIRLGYSTGPTRQGGGDYQRENEILLSPNTKYLWRITSNTDGNRVNFHGNWYEH